MPVAFYVGNEFMGGPHEHLIGNIVDEYVSRGIVRVLFSDGYNLMRRTGGSFTFRAGDIYSFYSEDWIKLRMARYVGGEVFTVDHLAWVWPHSTNDAVWWCKPDVMLTIPGSTWEAVPKENYHLLPDV